MRLWKKVSVRIVVFATLLIFMELHTQAQTYNWVKGGGTNWTVTGGSSAADWEATYRMCTDPHGNVYTLNLVSYSDCYADTFYAPGGTGSFRNLLFASYNCSGQMRFAKRITCSDVFYQGITADSLGNIYLALSLPHNSSGGTVLRIGYDTVITGHVYSRQALVKYDTSGHLHWIRFVGNNTPTAYFGTGGWYNYLALDSVQDPHMICVMYSGVVIRPGDTSKYGYTDLHYDPSGNLLTAKHLNFDTTLGIDEVSIDRSSNKLYVIGTRGGSFYPGMGYSYHPYVAAFDTGRNLIWKDTLTTPSGSSSITFGGITNDGGGHLYLSGTGFGGGVFRGDTVLNTVSTSGTPVAFTLRTDTSGSVDWHRGYSGTAGVLGFNDLTLMPNGKIASSGIMTGMVVGGTDTIISYAGEGQNAFFAITDTAGYVHTLQQIHGVGFEDVGRRVTSDRVGNLYIGGRVVSNIWGGSITPYVSIGGNSDFFVMKYGVDCGCTSMPTAAYTDTGTIVHGFIYAGTTTGIDSVRWTFGDGGTSIALNPIHTYTLAGDFSACVRVYTACGSDLYCKTITIPCVGAPVVSFAMSGVGLTRNFNFTAATAGLTSISWTSSDGGSGSGTPYTHAFAAAGTYTVCVTAVNPCGTTTTCSPVTITCTASPISSYTSGGSGLTKSFTYTGTTSGLDSVTWTYGDGGIATGLTPSHTYAAAGTYTVCAKVYTNCGTDTWCSTVVVTCITPPAASFTYTVTGSSVAFTYTGTITGMDSVRWTFDDGGTSALLNPSYTYTADGSFHVCVTVYTNCGSNTSCQNVIVTCTVPVTAAFTDTGSLEHGFLYSGTLAGYDSVVWDFGDGSADTGLTAQHTYAAYGSYHVCAEVFTACGTHTWCKDVAIGPVSVGAVTLSGIKVFPNPTDESLNVSGVLLPSGYRLINVIGVAVQQGKLVAGSNNISIRLLPPAVYLLEIRDTNGGQMTIRIVKQ